MTEPDLTERVSAQTDSGATEVMCGIERGRVFLKFPKAVGFVMFDPRNAVGVAKCMIDNAQACGLDVMVELPRRQVTDAMRDRLIARVAHVARSLADRKRTPGQIALEIVDICLRDVT